MTLLKIIEEELLENEAIASRDLREDLSSQRELILSKGVAVALVGDIFLNMRGRNVCCYVFFKSFNLIFNVLISLGFLTINLFRIIKIRITERKLISCVGFIDSL